MPMLVVHAIFVSRKIFRTVALNTVDDFFRRRPFRRLPTRLPGLGPDHPGFFVDPDVGKSQVTQDEEGI
jgi:hypothetical protein